MSSPRVSSGAGAGRRGHSLRGERARRLGLLAEELAAAYLRGAGCRVVAQNVRVGGGEIDLVIEDGLTLAFVEVKCRSRGSWAPAAGSLSTEQVRRLRRAASAYLQRRGTGGYGRPIRFDLIAIDWPSAPRASLPPIQWLRGMAL